MEITTPAALATGERVKTPVTVYYFHSTIRCETCLQLEELTAAILSAHFPEELRSGRVHWRPLNVVECRTCARLCPADAISFPEEQQFNEILKACIVSHKEKSS